jgi:hypothetical protein
LFLWGWVVVCLCLYYYYCYVVFLIIFSAFSFASLDNGYMFNLFTKQSILDILCSWGWQESLRITISVWGGFLYIANSIRIFDVLLILGIFICVPCFEYLLQPLLLMLEHPWLVHLFVVFQFRLKIIFFHYCFY